MLGDNRPDYYKHTCLFATFKFPRRRSLNQLVKVRSWIFFQLSSVFLVKVKPERPPLEVLEAILVQFSSQTFADNSKAELLRLLFSLFIEGGARIPVEGGARVSNAERAQLRMRNFMRCYGSALVRNNWNKVSLSWLHPRLSTTSGRCSADGIRFVYSHIRLSDYV